VTCRDVTFDSEKPTLKAEICAEKQNIIMIISGVFFSMIVAKFYSKYVEKKKRLSKIKQEKKAA
jgi:hypothetical protein